jgi:hypothetical protein
MYAMRAARALSFILTFTKGWSTMAGNPRRPPSLDLVSPPTPSITSDSGLQVVDEKTPSPAGGNRWQYPSPTPQWSPYFSPDTARPFPPPRSQFIRQPAPIPILPIRSISHCSRSSPLQIFRVLKPWLPLILYAITSLGFVAVVAFYRTELFICMSHQL